MTATFVTVVDLSQNQGAVDMVKMKASGVQGLILRVSHGRTLDTKYPAYYRDALAAGYAADDICVYTFVNPKRGTGAQCATATLDEIHRVVGHLRVGYMPDIENYANQSPAIGTAPVYGAAFADHIREHLATVHSEAPEAVTFGYTNRAYWNGPVGNGQEWVGDDALAAEIDWLAARYPAYSDATYARLGYPGTPDTWQDWAFRAQQQGPFLQDPLLKLFPHGFLRIELRLLRHVADHAPGCERALALKVLVDPCHDPEQRRFALAVAAEHADFRPQIEGERNVLDHDLLGVGLLQMLDLHDERRRQRRTPCWVGLALAMAAANYRGPEKGARL